LFFWDTVYTCGRGARFHAFDKFSMCCNLESRAVRGLCDFSKFPSTFLPVSCIYPASLASHRCGLLLHVSHVPWSVFCLPVLGTLVNCAKAEESIEMPFGMWTGSGPGNRILDGVPDISHWKGTSGDMYPMPLWTVDASSLLTHRTQPVARSGGYTTPLRCGLSLPFL